MVKEGVVSLPTKEEEDVVISSVTSSSHSRIFRQNKRFDQQGGENSCACACVVM